MKILTDTFTICYDFERKSPIAVYTEVTKETVDLLNIDPRPPFFTDKRLDKSVATSNDDYSINVLIPLIITSKGPHYEAPPPFFTVATQITTMHDRHVSLEHPVRVGHTRHITGVGK